MKTIHHVVDIDCPRDRVWAALAEEPDITKWWSTKVSSTPAEVGAVIDWTFADDFNPVMEVTSVDPRRELVWRCTSGHGPWQDGTFRFLLADLDDGRCRLRFWQAYAVELDDDAYGVYNFNWAYYLESLRLFCTTATGKPYQPA
jgi:uncharacterized protein YndB with AHSA1/START domain